MRPRHASILAMGLLLLAVAACYKAPHRRSTGPRQQSPRPDKPPQLDPAAALRPAYQVGSQPAVAAGTAFVIADASGRKFALTAAHVMEPAEWRQLKATTLETMAGRVVDKLAGKAVWVGTAFDQLPLLPSGMSNTRQDLVLLRLPKGSTAAPLKLASADPRPGDWVWVVGREANQEAGGQKTYLCLVGSVADGAYQLDMKDRFDLTGFSGGPVVNQQGEVVGNVLGGEKRQGIVIGTVVEAIRARLKDRSITPP